MSNDKLIINNKKDIILINNQMFSFFEAIGISKEEFNNSIFSQAINTVSDLLNEKTNFGSCYINILIEILKEKAKIYFKDESDYIKPFYELLKDFPSPKDSYKKAISNINLISKIEELYGIELSIDFLQNLMSENDVLKESVQVVFKENEQCIRSGKIDKLNLSEIVVYLLEIYCSNNNIEIKNADDFSEQIDDIPLNKDVNIYIKQISHFSLLTKEQVIDLSKRKDNGDKEAFDELVNHNLKLVLKVVGTIYCKFNCSLTLMDLIQEGNIGLMKAVQRYDWTKGSSFSTYAVWWIRQSIMRAIYKTGKTIRLPVNVYLKIYDFNKAVSELSKDLKREPTCEEISERLQIPLDKVYAYFDYQREPISLDKPIDNSDDDSNKFGDFISSNENIEDEVCKTNLWELVKQILDRKNDKDSKRTIDIVAQRMGFDEQKVKTLDEISKEYSVSKERVRQIEKKAIDTLKLPYNMKKILECLDISEEEKHIDKSLFDNSTYELLLEELCKNINVDVLLMKVFLYKVGAYDEENKSNKYLAEFLGVRVNRLSSLIKSISMKLHDEKSLSQFKILRMKIAEMDSITKVKEINEIKERFEIMSGRKMTSMYNLLGCTKEKMFELMEKYLTEEEIRICNKRNGTDVDNPNGVINEEERKTFYVIINNLKAILSRYDKDEGKNDIVGENVNEQSSSIKDVNEETIKTPVFDTELGHSSDNELEDTITSEDAANILNEIKSPPVTDLVTSLPSDTAIITMLRFGYFKNKCFSMESIAKFLGVSEEVVKNAILETLNTYKDFAMSLVDASINKVNISHDNKLQKTME